MLNTLIIFRFWGFILLIFAAFMATSLIPSLVFNDGAHWSLGASVLITATVAALLLSRGNTERKLLHKKDGYLIVLGSWVLMCILGAVPFFLAGSFQSVADVFFESVSGITTTGASILEDIEAQRPSVLYWRSMLQWIGAMGIIVLTVAILPLLGVGGVELFTAESSMPASDKIHPRIGEVAKKLWFIYAGLTLVNFVAYVAAGMGIFDAVNHAFTTMATGGFSNKNDSMAHFNDNPLIIYICVTFMLISSVNYTLLYFGFRGNIKRVWASDEFKAFVLAIILAITLVTLLQLNFSEVSTQGEVFFRDILFQVTSILTTTGFATADYVAWGPVLAFLFLLLFFIGGCAGSTSGSFKIVRHLVLFRHSIMEFRRVLHPNAVLHVKLDKKPVDPRIINHILVFLLIFLFLFVAGALMLVMMGMDFVSAVGASAACISNVGPGIGSVGPAFNFAHVPEFGKVVLMFLMLAGRLELFTVIIFFTPEFWR